MNEEWKLHITRHDYQPQRKDDMAKKPAALYEQPEEEKDTKECDSDDKDHKSDLDQDSKK